MKSPQGTQFRIWARQRLKEYIIKGFDFTKKLKKLVGLYNERALRY